MALQAEQIYIADSQHVNVCAPVRDVAGCASLDLHWFVLKDKGALLVGMASEANRVLCRCTPHLFGKDGAVNIMTVAALDESFVNAMMEGHLELRPLLQVAGITKLWLRFHEQELFCFGMVR